MLGRMASGGRADGSRRSSGYRRHGPRRPAPTVRARWALRRARDSRRSALPTSTQLLLLAGVALSVGLVAARRRCHLPTLVSLGLVSAAPFATAVVLPRSRWRYGTVGVVYMWSFAVAWTLPYENREALRRRLRIDYPVRIDSVLGFGVPPTQRLQRAFRDPNRVTKMDRAVTLAYGSWFVPHFILAWLLWRHHEFVPRAAARLAAAYHLTVPFYYLIPTAPPWWASEEAGLMNGEVQRVRRLVIEELTGRRTQGDDSSGGNPWASMPSDHVASAAITAMGLAELGPVHGALGKGYVVVSIFSVVYLGEHYLIDALVGLAIAYVIQRAEAAVSPFAIRIVTALDQLRG